MTEKDGGKIHVRVHQLVKSLQGSILNDDDGWKGTAHPGYPALRDVVKDFVTDAGDCQRVVIGAYWNPDTAPCEEGLVALR